MGLAGADVENPSGALASSVIYSPGANVDVGPLIQHAIDAGATLIQLAGHVPFLLNSAVFDDLETSLEGTQPQQRQLVIEGNGTTPLVLGPGLPTTSAFTPDAATQWGFFPNTKRSALKEGVVACTAETAVHGEVQRAGPSFVLRRMVLQAEGKNRGAVFSNRCSGQLDHCFLSRMKFGLSWAGYSDRQSVKDCWLSNPEAQAEGAVTDCWAIYQQTNADAVFIEGGEANGAWGWAHCKHTRGFRAENLVGGGFSFTECDNVQVAGWHAEMFETHRPVPSVFVDRSHVTLEVQDYSGQEAGAYFLEVNDAEEEAHQYSTVRLRGTAQYHATPKDTPRQPDIYLANLNPGSRIILDGGEGRTEAASTGNTFANAIYVKAAQAAVAEALEGPYPPFLRAGVAADKWELRQTSNGWELGLPGSAGIQGIPGQATPTLTSAFATGIYEGNLEAGKTYNYAAAILNDDTSHTAATAAFGHVPGALGAIGLAMRISATPAAVILWRKKEGNPLTEAEAFAVIPVPNIDVLLYDSGNTVGGFSWKTETIPTPYTVSTDPGTRITQHNNRVSTTPLHREIWLPELAAGQTVPTSESAPGIAYRAAFQRMLAYGGGILEEVWCFAGATVNGKTRAAILDIGEANPGEFTVLWESAELELAEKERWAKLGEPKIKVRPGQPLLAALMNNGTTATFGRTALPDKSPAAKLPASFLPYANMPPLLCGEHTFAALSFGGTGAKIASATLAESSLAIHFLGKIVK